MNNLTDSTLTGLLFLIHRLQRTGQLLGRETIFHRYLYVVATA
ncbi:MAG TPA: hypothetical protein VFY66_00770 [Anaerolineales bacterium]|nr:hypothetical protein [Anaerolineales bacterium]